MQRVFQCTTDGCVCRRAAWALRTITCCKCRLLNLWLSDKQPTAGGQGECLELAVTTAELAEAASCSEGLPGGQAPLLRFLDGCQQVSQSA